MPFRLLRWRFATVDLDGASRDVKGLIQIGEEAVDEDKSNPFATPTSSARDANPGDPATTESDDGIDWFWPIWISGFILAGLMISGLLYWLE